MPNIQGIYAREILDSRGLPTIECTLWLDNGGIVVTSVPAGTSVGKYEAKELRDNDPSRMMGKGVLQAVNNINTIIAPQLVGKDPTQQKEIDQLLITLDGTPDKSKLGANTILGVSQAVCKAGALTNNVALYYYIFNTFQLAQELFIPTNIFTVINGGEHGADNLDLQEFQILPASHISFPESLSMAVTLFQKLEEVLILKGAIHSVGLVGGFTPNLYSNSDVFEILVETIKSSPYTLAQDLFFGVDAAASEFYSGGKYTLRDRSQPYANNELIEYYKKIRSLYNVFYLEDPFAEDDTGSWETITKYLGDTTRIVGDSLLATNEAKVKEAIEKKYCNTLLVKPNQVGTITETIGVISLARQAGWSIVVSHRSGETNDDFIADFAVGVGAEYSKFGPPNRGERTAKYNRLAQIYQELEISRQQQAATPQQPQP
jgi:enolase